MKQRYPGTPSVRFLWNTMFRRFRNQRVEFQLADNDYINRHKQRLAEAGFDLSRPVVVNAIFGGMLKKARNPGVFGRGPCKDCEVQFIFRDVIYKQDDKIAWMFPISRQQNKKREMRFWWNDIKSFGDSEFLTTLKGLYPEQLRLTHESVRQPV